MGFRPTHSTLAIRCSVTGTWEPCFATRCVGRCASTTRWMSNTESYSSNAFQSFRETPSRNLAHNGFAEIIHVCPAPLRPALDCVRQVRAVGRARIPRQFPVEGGRRSPLADDPTLVLSNHLHQDAVDRRVERERISLFCRLLFRAGRIDRNAVPGKLPGLF